MIFRSKNLRETKICSNFRRRLAYGKSPESTCALSCKQQSFAEKTDFMRAELIFYVKILHISKICCTFGLRLLRIPPNLRSHYRANNKDFH